MGRRKDLKRRLKKAKEYVLELPERASMFKAMVEISWEQAFVAESVYVLYIMDAEGEIEETVMTETEIREEYGEDVLEQFLEAIDDEAENITLHKNTTIQTTGDWGLHTYDQWTLKDREVPDAEN